MRTMQVWAGLAIAIVTLTSSFALGGPLDKNATSKVNGDNIGGDRGTTYRPYNFSPPLTTGEAAVSPAQSQTRTSKIEQAPAAPPTAEKPTTASRSFSYDAPDATTYERPAYRNYRSWSNNSRYLHADRKARGEY